MEKGEKARRSPRPIEVAMSKDKLIEAIEADKSDAVGKHILRYVLTREYQDAQERVKKAQDVIDERARNPLAKFFKNRFFRKIGLYQYEYKAAPPIDENHENAPQTYLLEEITRYGIVSETIQRIAKDFGISIEDIK